MHQYQVLDNQLLTDTTRLLTLECSDENTPLLFQPGQYAAVGLRDKLRPTVMRCFSITSSPTNQQILQFSMRVKGRYTSALQRLKKGDKIAVRGPFGGFVFNQHAHDNVVFFAGGIGIAPFISMIRYASELHLATPIHLIYSCRNQNDIPFIKELTDLQHKNPHLTISYVIGEGPSARLVGAKVISGKIDNSNLSRLNLDFKQQTFFVCGPPPYMNAIFKLLKENGAPESKVLSEAFSQSNRHQTGKLKSWPFNIYALSGLALLATGFFVVASDLYKTLPKLEASSTPTTTSKKNVISSNGNVNGSVSKVPPTVSTNINQKDIIKNAPPSSSGSISPVPTYTAPPTATVKPSPTQTPSTPPVTKVS